MNISKKLFFSVTIICGILLIALSITISILASIILLLILLGAVFRGEQVFKNFTAQPLHIQQCYILGLTLCSLYALYDLFIK